MMLVLSLGQDNQGNEFYITFIANLPPDSTVQLAVFVTTAETSPVSFSVTTSTSSDSGIATAGTVQTFTYPSTYQLQSATDRDKWIHVKAEGSKKIIVYGANERAFTTDTFLALPIQADSSDVYTYIAVMEDNLGYNSEIGIVASTYNTQVSITLTQSTYVGTTYTAAGSTTQITLQEADTLLIASLYDLSGTVVSSNKPISFFSGHECTNVPNGIRWCDHIVEQLPPTENWGSRFATAPLLTRTAYDRFRLVAAEDSTSVYIDCTRSDDSSGYSTNVNLDAHEYFAVNIPSTDFCWIEGSHRILVVQFSVGQEADGVISDPFMAMVPPVDQYSNAYTLATVPSVVQEYNHYMSIFIPTAFYQPDQIYLNGLTLTQAGLQFTSIKRFGTVEVYAARATVPEGVQTLHHTNQLAKLGVLMYGYGSYNSYGYPGGLQLQQIGKTKYSH